MDTESLQSFVGRSQSIRDVAAAGTLAGLAALLDHSAPPWPPDELPPLAHWLYFVPRQRQSLLDTDGHPRRGDFLPPVTLPRRMWVGSRERQIAVVPLDSVMERRSTIASVTEKRGRSGPMVFVTVKHEVIVGDAVAVIEEQDIVYRAAQAPQGNGSGVPGPGAATPAATTARASAVTRAFVPDPVLLFRFSALTFNGHRIHYDRDYAREVEGYPGLVVHGPLVATLLMDHYLRYRRDQQILNFSFRAERPLFDTAPFELCLAENGTGFDLWALDATGAIAVSATVENR
jgi:3-methylfumaryl-CoA hydratase